jgi:LacI family transcriptional regulator
MTIREIADLAGVSIGTVDRVLYKRGRVSAATKEKVEAIIEKYQFTPNPIARRLKRGHTYTFCTLTPRKDQDADYWDQIMEGLRTGADDLDPLGVETELIDFDRYDGRAFQDAVGRLLEKAPDGIVFAPFILEETKPAVKKIQEAGIPYILIDSDIPDIAPLCTIGTDSFRGGYLAGRLMHLLVRDFTKPAAVLNGFGEYYHIARRRDGFLQYAAEYGIPTIAREYSNFLESEDFEREIIHFLEENRELSGIFITSYLTCFAADAIKKTGRENLILIGYDLIPKNRNLLTENRINAIISQRPEDQGRQALRNLYRHLVLEQEIPLKIEMPLDVYFKENIPRQ